ncbi:MAG: DUF3131 domain-containing protein [Clostridia bacterium]|nr:DUF3131 domain-containing protein [Clostridia bacterium]
MTDKSKKEISSAYKKAMKHRTKSGYEEWLCDNAYLICREAEALSDALKGVLPLPTGKNGLPNVFYIADSVYNETTDFDTDTMLTAFSKKKLSGVECEVLPMMLKAVITVRTANSLKAEKGEKTGIISKAIRTLHRLPDIDFERINKEINPTEKQLLRDPSGVYGRMDEESKATYRSMVMKEASRKGVDEERLAVEKVNEAEKGTDERTRHIGSGILPEYRKKRGTLFLILECLLPLVLSVAAGIFIKWYIAPLIFFPLYASFSGVLTAVSLKGVGTLRLPGMKIGDEIPESMMTLITVSTLLPSAGKTEQTKAHLEQLYLSNGEKNVRVCLLADMKNSGTPERPEDNTNIEACKRMIKELNDRYGRGFILAVRPRVYAKTEGYFSGWERKRGAITQLVREIKGETGGFLCLYGDTKDIDKVQYLMALDSDTDLPFDSLRRLISVAAHPVNKAYVDKEKGSVTKGYGIFAPRVCCDILTSKTPFGKIMCSDTGISSYSNTVSERYQDLFGEGIFSGKGLVDVDAFYGVLNDALPEGRILSHDILEGGYLRCAFVSDVQVLDGFPSSQSVYFDRQSRWIRGDWQNLRFIFSKNPLNALSRFKLFDNLRRALTPPLILLALIISIFLPAREATVVALIGLIGAANGNFTQGFRTLFANGFSMLSRLFYSEAIPASLASFVRGIVMIMMLPQNAVKSGVSVILALWRSFVSKKRLLDWTTFAQSGKSGSFKKDFIDCLCTAAVSSLLFISDNPVLKLCAILFMVDIPFLFISRKSKKTKETKLSYLDKEYLMSSFAAMWSFFEDQCNEENNFLPPDNVQETPVYRVAHRTSPTNIGLALLCVLSARDFGLIDSTELYNRLKKMFASVAMLKKYKGNLLNWYNTQNLKPLQPEYVSTVDCGNFMCCLKALKEGVAEYMAEEPKLSEIVSECKNQLLQSDLSVFYNRRRNLFHIGIDPETEKLSDSYYDLLMSEARMTSYYAVAERVVPKKHWAQLSRTMSRSGRFTGLVSWTGTMFEYFMPYIFLPGKKGTLCYEALKYCSWCQRKRVDGIPFGMSESGFYAFDRDFNYQYKAHGVGSLGLRRELDNETVISPYSSFLLLPLEPETAIKNLKKIEKMNMCGRWGFYEAIDFTPSRTNGRKYAVVRSYMAHHIGMSMLSVANLLKDGVFQKRFMRDRRMKSAESLLSERIETDAYVFRQTEKKDVRTVRERSNPVRNEVKMITPIEPTAKAVTNGEMTLIMTDVGASVTFYRGVCLLKHGKDLLRYPQGVIVNVKDGKKTLCATRMPQYSDMNHKCTFSGGDIIHKASQDGISVKVRTSIHPTLTCEQRVITVKNSRQKPFDGRLTVYAEPMLDSYASEQNHPAFSKLFIVEKHDKKSGITVYGRKERDGNQGVYLAIGFLKETEFRCERSKHRVIDTAYDKDSLFVPERHFEDSDGDTDCCFAAEINLHIPSRGASEHILLMTCASSAQEAVNRLLQIRKKGEIKERKGAMPLFSEGTAESVLTEKLLVPTVFSQSTEKNPVNLPYNTVWNFGISGDNPIFFASIEDKDSVTEMIPYFRVVQRLRACGIMCDLAVCYEEGGDYDSPIQNALKDTLKRESGLSNDSENGIYFINLHNFSKAQAQFLKSVAVFNFDTAFKEKKQQKVQFERVPVSDTKTVESVKRYNFTDGGISIYKMPQKPYLPWCLTISNKNFGTMVSDKALGFTWAINSRENKLTPWYNEIASDNRGELLIMQKNGRIYDIIRASTAFFTPKKASWSGEAENLTFKTEVTVDSKALCKKCKVTVTNNTDEKAEINLIYYIEPVLSSDRGKERFITTEKLSDGFVFTSDSSTVKGFGALRIAENADIRTTDRTAVLSGDFFSDKRSYHGCIAVGKTVTVPEKGKTELLFSLSWGRTRKSVLKMPQIETRSCPEYAIQMQSAYPDIDRMFNTWLPWQINSCRIDSRTGFYQCGGAWGFRDQLQDVSSLLLTDPKKAKVHIIRCAAVQFKQGDVLHWWHVLPYRDGGIKGVRTRYSDDLLWLPLVTSEYVKTTGDRGILDINIPYIEGDLLNDDETERYFSPHRSKEKEPLIEHCIRAVDRSLSTGPNGLSLIGSGDWNDGFNNIGVKGRGESVWLSMFLVIVLRRMSELCDLCGKREKKKLYVEKINELSEAIEEKAWSGDRYIRAIMDDGTVIGKAGESTVRECEIDSIAQSFAVFAELPDRQRVKKALKTAVRELVDEEKGIIKLLSPPFTGKGKQAGYITSYPQGIRENGGQYTHAAVWLCAALIMSGESEEGFRLLRMINPSYFCENEDKMYRYGAEPYALAGDVPMSDRESGCTGWNLYTGSAGWYYRTLMSLVLGLRKEGDKLYVKMSAPASMYPLKVKLYNDSWGIHITCTHHGATRLFVDGKECDFIPVDGKSHTAELKI